MPDQFMVLAENTPSQCAVLDARAAAPWATHSGPMRTSRPDMLVIHHTYLPIRAGTIQAQRLLLLALAKKTAWGVPYHFVIFPGAKRRIWYLHDWRAVTEHVGTEHDAVGIALWGDYHADEPPKSLIARTVRLIAALERTWGGNVAVVAHRDIAPVTCPGDNAFDALLRAGVLDK